MISNRTPQSFGFYAVAACSPTVSIGNPVRNADSIIEMLNRPDLKMADFIVFPELSLTGYTCGDLFFQDLLYIQLEKAVAKLLNHLKEDHRFIVVGLPVEFKGSFYNCAMIITGRKILGVVPKINIPNYQEFYEKRWFRSGEGIKDANIKINNIRVPFGTDLIFSHKGVKVGVEICEDLWVPNPPSSTLAQNGATLIMNLSATDDLIGKYTYLKNLISNQSGRGRCAYAYASAGKGESTTDLVFSGHDIIAVDGNIQAETKNFDRNDEYVMSWVDFQRLRNDRRKFSSFFQAESLLDYRILDSEIKDDDNIAYYTSKKSVLPYIDPLPFVPTDIKALNANCDEIVSIQSWGLEQRLIATGTQELVVGISGGLDSTLALLVANHTFSRLKIDPKKIHAVTMPSSATSSRTYENALTLMNELGVSILEINIQDAVKQHFKDIDHNPDIFDAVYENSQARERTQILMDLANKYKGLVLGTGDLSELALGWCTYNGDQMSMYNVNGGVPKTLVKHLVKWFASNSSSAKLHDVLNDIVDTPISPELIPSKSSDSISQKTENLIGPYELHDFFLYHMLRNGFEPLKILWMAQLAFKDSYKKGEIKKWLTTFYTRFFSQQFKRSCMPDGPKVGSVCLSPRGDWRMPSDVAGKNWIASLANIEIHD